jgi:hypothetical protein
MSHRESLAAGDKMSQLRRFQNSSQSSISSLLRPSVMTPINHNEIRSPFGRETISPGELFGHERLTIAQSTLISHYS